MKSKVHDVPLHYFEEAYLAVLGANLQDIDEYAALPTDEAKKRYIATQIHPAIPADKKGDVGEWIHDHFFRDRKPGFQAMETKLGRNGFDGVYYRTPEGEPAGAAPDRIYVVEVKYNEAKLGDRTIDGQKWRQLSNPYVLQVLRDYDHHVPTQATSALVRNHRNQVRFRLAYFDPIHFKLTEYRVGDMNKSLLN